MKKLLIAATTIAAALAIPTVTLANGPCGQNSDGNHACGVTSPSSQSGSIATSNERDYYVFHAQQNTQLHVAITNTEDPSCSQPGGSSCGTVAVQLTDAQGNEITETEVSEPYNGITVPRTLDYTLEKKGNYYLIVRGSLAYDSFYNGHPVPYQLDVTASPNVVWPAPQPYTVKKCTKHTRYRWVYKGRRRHRHRVHVRVTYTTCRTVTVYP
jgi:hypothetical protein